MNVQGTTRIMETNSYDVVNQYLRFGWKLINQHVIESDGHRPTMMNYSLAFVRTLEDTRRLELLDDLEAANRYLAAGWKLIDKYLVRSDNLELRDERLHFVLAWQTEEEPIYPVDGDAAEPIIREFPVSDELEPLE
jgi:hypothetical protein